MTRCCHLTKERSQAARLSVLAMLLVLAACQPAVAITVLLKEGGPPVRGKLVRETLLSVVIAVRQPDGSVANREIENKQIARILNPVSKEKLEALTRDNPQAYRDYAEELAEKKVDPDAQEMGIRLFLIAAYLAPKELGRSSLLGMTALARSRSEARRFQAMVYLLDPTHDRSVLERKPPPTAPPPAAPTKAKKGNDDVKHRLAQALLRLRRGQIAEARNLSRKEDVKKELRAHAHILPAEAFFESLVSRCPQCQRGHQKCSMCRGTGRRAGSICPNCRGRKRVLCSRCAGDYREPPLPENLLRQVLLLEMTLRGEDVDGSATPSKDVKAAPVWSQVIASGRTQPVNALRLETLTEFDPRKCRYRDGKWVKP